MFESSGGREGSGGGASGAAAPVLERLDDAVAGVLDRRVDELDEAALRAELAALEDARRRLHTRVCTVTATLTDRQARRAREAHPRDPRAGERAVRDTQTALAGELGWTPSEAKANREVGQTLSSSPEAAVAASEGGLSVGHLRHLHRTLKHLLGQQRREAEARLLAAARMEDVVTFGRTCQAVLAELDAAAVEQAETRRWQRRRASVTRTPDGMTQVFGQWAGIDAEEVETAIRAFRRPDAPDEMRTAEQRTADAIADWARAALAGDRTPTQHGTRPHVVMTIAAEDLKTRDPGAPVTFGSDRTTILAAVRTYLDDANWSWIAVDPDGVPIEAGPETRHPPVALWRALVLRDGGCIADGCDARPEWCDVMHLGDWHKDGGHLTLDTAGLGCRTHHRRYDHHGWTITWNGRRPVLNHPDRPPGTTPRAGPDPGG